MECASCHAKIEAGDEKQHLGQTLCEDCYMDALSPVKTCDPWAVHSAKSFEKHAESAPTLTPIQSEILSILKETGGIEPQALLAKAHRQADAKGTGAGVCSPSAHGKGKGREAGRPGRVAFVVGRTGMPATIRKQRRSANRSRGGLPSNAEA